MSTQITHGIKITAKPRFEPNYSNLENQQFVFSYKITIENTSDQQVQLLSRQWHIYDSVGQQKIVEGEGVVGEQPRLNPGESYTYSSWCPLISDMGMMWGTYLMQNLQSKDRFRVRIPKFELVSDCRKN